MRQAGAESMAARAESAANSPRVTIFTKAGSSQSFNPLELQHLSVKPRDQVVKRGLRARIGTADKNIDRSQSVFGPSMNRNVRFCEQCNPGYAFRRPEVMQLEIEQRRSRPLGRFGQHLGDERRIVQPGSSAQIGDQVGPVGHASRLVNEWPSRRKAASAAATP